MTLYIDLIFLENVFMNAIIIYGTAIILKKEIKIVRILLGSILGAIYACIYYVTNLVIYSSVLLKVLLSFAIVYISFNSKTLKSFLKELLIFYLTSFTFGGVTFAMLYLVNPKKIIFQNGTLMGIYPLKMILIGGLIGFIIVITSFKTIKSRIAKKDMVCTINIHINDKERKLKAIIDTGNFLKEPITGSPVIIVEKECLKNIIPENILNNLDGIIKGNIEIDKDYLPRIKLIPFSSLGLENGLLLGFKPDIIIIEYQGKQLKNKNVIIGIYSKRLNKSNKYNALIGLDIIEKVKED